MNFLGIDPSLRTAGAAFFDSETYQLVHVSGKIIDVMREIDLRMPPGEVVVIMEDPGLDRNTFGAVGMITAKAQEYKAGKASKQELEMIAGVATKMSRDVGENAGAAEVFKQWFEERNIPVLCVKPSERDKAYKRVKVGKGMSTRRLNVLGLKLPTKTTQEQYKQLTGHVGRTNEHERDAGTLVYGRSAAWVRHRQSLEIIAKQKKAIPAKYRSVSAGSYDNDELF